MEDFFFSRLLSAFEEHLVSSGLRGFSLERWLMAAYVCGDYVSLCRVVASYGRCGDVVDSLMMLGPSNDGVCGYFASGGV